MVSTMLKRLLRHRTQIDYHRLVSLYYEVALDREADEAGLRSYVDQLESGSIDPVGLMETLRVSDEFSRKNRTYDFRNDAGVKKFLTDDVIRLSGVLENSKPISFEEYSRAFDDVFTNPAKALIVGQWEYGAVHKNRFYELVNALHILGVNTHGATVLEFGASEFSAIYGRIFPEMALDIADRPVPEDYIGFTREVALGRLAARHYFSIDLNEPSLFHQHTKYLPRYSHILFCEVLEHLTVNPVELFAFLLGLLNDGGLIYLTTPNFFSYKNLQRIRSWENPQEVYPVTGENWDTHFHHREFSLKELLRFSELSGGVVKAFYHSGCWDVKSAILDGCPAMRGNLVLVIEKN
jgi:hypothetical protein